MERRWGLLADVRVRPATRTWHLVRSESGVYTRPDGTGFVRYGTECARAIDDWSPTRAADPDDVHPVCSDCRMIDSG